jgi:hypothetical protein
MRTEPSTEAGMVPLQHVCCQAIVDELALEKEVNHGGTEALAEPDKTQPAEVHEPTHAIEAPFQYDSVQMRIEPCDLPVWGAVLAEKAAQDLGGR